MLPLLATPATVVFIWKEGAADASAADLAGIVVEELSSCFSNTFCVMVVSLAAPFLTDCNDAADCATEVEEVAVEIEETLALELAIDIAGIVVNILGGP